MLDRSDFDYRNLLAGVLENPAHTGRRMILADRIEELGDEGRAAFIRTQCDRPGWFLGLENDPHILDEPNRERLIQATGWMHLTADHELKICLRGMGNCLGVEGGFCWWRQAEFRVIEQSPIQIDDVRMNAGRPYLPPVSEVSYVMHVEWSRGFVGEIALPVSLLMNEHIMGALFSTQPIERVTLKDRRPSSWEVTGQRGPVRHYYAWYDRRRIERLDLPDALVGPELTGEFDSERAALDAVSRRCVNHGRRIAGLPALPE